MRILSVLTQKPFGTGSGAYMTGVITALRGAGHEQAVVGGIMADETMPWDGTDGIIPYPVYYGTEELPFPVVGMSDQMPYKSTLYRNLTPEMEKQLHDAFYKVLHKAVEEFQPDLIICHHLYLLTSWVRNWFPEHRVYGVCHGSDLRQHKMTDKWREEISDSIRRLDRVYALHGVQKKQVEEQHKVQNVRILGSAINQNIFCAEDKKTAENTPLGQEAVKTLLYVGKMARSKGVVSLLHAVEALPYEKEAFRMVLVGGPGNEEETDEIRKLAENSRFRVTFTGLLKPDQVAELYRKADCFVLPSFYEGLPLVIFEAKACGAPVVCTDLPGVKDWADTYVSGHNIEFVKMPAMIGADEPDPAAVGDFEKRLSEALRKKLDAGREEEPSVDLSALTWAAVADRLTMK